MKKKNVSWNVSLIQTQTQEPLETSPFFILNRVSSKTLFFPSVMIEWNNLDKSIRNSKSFSIFLKNILKYIRPSPNSTYNCINTTCITFHFLFDCPSFINKISLLLNHIWRLTKDKLHPCNTLAIKFLLYGDDSLDLITNTLILNTFVDFILSSKRYDGPLL